MIVKNMAIARMPLENAEALGFVNSLIDGTIWKDKLREYQESLPNIAEESKGFYGYAAYWSFLNQHKDEIESMKPVHFAEDRAKWYTPQNFELMYDVIYNNFESTGIAKQCDLFYADKYGNKVDPR